HCTHLRSRAGRTATIGPPGARRSKCCERARSRFVVVEVSARILTPRRLCLAKPRGPALHRKSTAPQPRALPLADEFRPLRGSSLFTVRPSVSRPLIPVLRVSDTLALCFFALRKDGCRCPLARRLRSCSPVVLSIAAQRRRRQTVRYSPEHSPRLA